MSLDPELMIARFKALLALGPAELRGLLALNEKVPFLLGDIREPWHDVVEVLLARAEDAEAELARRLELRAAADMKLVTVIEKRLGTREPDDVEALLVQLQTPVPAPVPKEMPPVPSPVRAVPPPGPTTGAPDPFLERARHLATLPQDCLEPCPDHFRIRMCACGQRYLAPLPTTGKQPTRCWSCLGKVGQQGRVASWAIYLRRQEEASDIRSKSGARPWSKPGS